MGEFLDRIHGGNNPSLASLGHGFDLGFMNLLKFLEISDLFIY